MILWFPILYFCFLIYEVSGIGYWKHCRRALLSMLIVRSALINFFQISLNLLCNKQELKLGKWDRENFTWRTVCCCQCYVGMLAEYTIFVLFQLSLVSNACLIFLCYSGCLYLFSGVLFVIITTFFPPPHGGALSRWWLFHNPKALIWIGQLANVQYWKEI